MRHSRDSPHQFALFFRNVDILISPNSEKTVSSKWQFANQAVKVSYQGLQKANDGSGFITNINPFPTLRNHYCTLRRCNWHVNCAPKNVKCKTSGSYSVTNCNAEKGWVTVGLKWTNMGACKIVYPHTKIESLVRIIKVFAINYMRCMNVSARPIWVWICGTGCSTLILRDMQ